jgi:outer membrane protein insertion porin family
MKWIWILVLTLATSVGAIAQPPEVIREIIVRGNAQIQREAIVAAMRSRPDGPFLQAELTNDEQAIRDLGFFSDVKVLSRSLGPGEWQIVVEVAENPVVREIRVIGNTVIPTEAILKAITQPVGEVYNLRNARPTSDAITQLYQEKGYFAQADIAPLEGSPNTLNIQVIERTVNQILVQGLTRTQDRVIRRLIKTKDGEAFSEFKWETDRRRIDSTQWFESVNARSRATEELGKFDLLLEVKEARTAQIAVGAALDPRSRLAGNLRYFDTNFRGTGQSVGMTLQQDTSGGGLSVTADYSNPFMDNRDTSLSVRAFSRINSYFSGSGIGGSDSPTGTGRFDERRTGGSVGLSRPFREVYGASVGLTFERVQTVNFDVNDATRFIQQDGDLAVLNLALIRDRRDVALDPNEGDYLRFSLEPGFSNITRIGGAVGGETELLGRNTFLRSNLEYKAFFSRRPPRGKPLDTPRQVVAVRARYGAITGRVPFFEQLFVGGSDSLRGYSDQRFWGKQMALASAEYRFPIQRSFTLIGFADYGGAWGGFGTIQDFTQSRTPRLRLGYGAGVAFRTPLGAIRIDFGFNQEGGSRTHFSIGGSF